MKYGMFSTIEENYAFIKSNPKDQRGRDSIKWIAPYMNVIRKYARDCSHVTEFGINQVNSTYALLAAKPKKVVSVDIDLNRRPSKKVVAFEKRNLWLDWAKYLADLEGIEFVVLEADDASIEIEETDLLFIDSKHELNHINNLLSKHKNRVNKYLIFHDTTLFKRQVMPAVQGLLDEGDFEVVEHFKSSPGLMVLRRVEK